MVIKAAATTLKQPRRHESQTMTAICHDLVRQVLPRQRLISTAYFTKYLTYSSAGIGSLVHRASTEGKLHKRRSFTPSVMGTRLSCLARL